MSARSELETVMDAAREAVAAAAEAGLRHFRTALQVERKADESPVTIADREAEAAALAVIHARFPDHAVLGEEGGQAGERGPWRWIVDPIDGTRGFTRGGPFWGPLIAAERDGEVVVGAMALPVVGRSYWAAHGLGAFRDGERLQVSQVEAWPRATLSLGELRYLLQDPWGPGVKGLIDTADSSRCYGDLAGCALLLEGVADTWLEAGVALWDLAPLKVLVEEAGGRFTDFEGRPSLERGQAAATNGRLHAHVLQALSGA